MQAHCWLLAAAGCSLSDSLAFIAAEPESEDKDAKGR